MTQSCVWHMTRSYAWHNAFICATQVHSRPLDMTDAWNESSPVDMTHSYAWHDSCIWYAWHDVFVQMCAVTTRLVYIYINMHTYIYKYIYINIHINTIQMYIRIGMIYYTHVYTNRFDTSHFLACTNVFGMTVEGLCVQWLCIIGMWNDSCPTFHTNIWLWKRHVCNDCGSSACETTHDIYFTRMNECGRNMCAISVGHRHVVWLSHVLLTYEWAFHPQSSHGMTMTSIMYEWAFHPQSCNMLIHIHAECSSVLIYINAHSHEGASTRMSIPQAYL